MDSALDLPLCFRDSSQMGQADGGELGGHSRAVENKLQSDTVDAWPS